MKKSKRTKSNAMDKIIKMIARDEQMERTAAASGSPPTACTSQRSNTPAAASSKKQSARWSSEQCTIHNA